GASGEGGWAGGGQGGGGLGWVFSQATAAGRPISAADFRRRDAAYRLASARSGSTASSQSASGRANRIAVTNSRASVSSPVSPDGMVRGMEEIRNNHKGTKGTNEDRNKEGVQSLSDCLLRVLCAFVVHSLVMERPASGCGRAGEPPTARRSRRRRTTGNTRSTGGTGSSAPGSSPGCRSPYRRRVARSRW